MDEKDKQKFLDDFKKGDIQKKLDMWFYALEQDTLWDEILSTMSDVATEQNFKRKIKA